MLIKALGAIDVLAGLILLVISKIDFPTQFVLILGILIAIKSSLGMFRDFGSWIDLFAGMLILLSLIISIPMFLGLVAGLLLIQKGVASFL